MGTKINNKLKLPPQVYKKEQIGKIKMRRQSPQREGLINKRNAVSVVFIFKILSFTNSLDVKNCRLVASKLAHNVPRTGAYPFRVALVRC